MLKSTSSRHRISPCRPQTKDAGVTHECNRAVVGSKESITLFTPPQHRLPTVTHAHLRRMFNPLGEPVVSAALELHAVSVAPHAC